MTITKVRFAPSPTGPLHLGSARTALFNYLFAKSTDGQFLLRIDDTDPVRSDPIYTKNIINSLNWLGIKWHGEILYQSQRKNLYQDAINSLLSSGHAYKSYTTPEIEEEISAIHDITEKKKRLRETADNASLDIADMPYTVRFKAPINGYYEFSDCNIGSMTIKYEEVDDFVLLRQDGLPTYMLASVVDDHDTNITHIIRGIEHMSNTKRQIPLMLALGYHLPTYIHIPLINNEDGTKLSKRAGAKSIHEYQQDGFLPEAIINYVCLLGWGHSDSQEIISIDEAIAKFDLKDLRKSASRFDLNKMLSINQHYIQLIPTSDLLHHIKTLYNMTSSTQNMLEKCIDNMRTKADTLQYMIDMSMQIFESNTVHIRDELPQLNLYEQRFINSFDMDKIHFESIDSIKNDIMHNIDSAKQEYGDIHICKKNLLMYMRIMLTGMRQSPGLFDIMYAIGPSACQERLHHTMQHINH